MPNTYFSFAIADSMFPPNAAVRRKQATAESAAFIMEQGDGVISALNPSHSATVAAMKERFGLDVPIPDSPPRVALGEGDTLIVMSVRGLPRLTDNRHYSKEEIAAADFTFGVWQVL